MSGTPIDTGNTKKAKRYNLAPGFQKNNFDPSQGMN